MKLIRDLIRYFTPKPHFKRPPLQIINDYDIRDSSEDEQLVMLANRARCPENARQLLKRNKLDDLVKPQPVRRTTFRARLKRLIMNMAGHTPGDPYRVSLGNKGKYRI